jgi:hypothetical protein
MHVCGSLVLGQRSDPLAEVLPVLVRVAILGILKIVVGRQPYADTFATNCLGTFLDHFQWKADPILYRSAIVVGSRIDIVVEKLVNKVSIGAMNLDPVEASLNSFLRGDAPFLGDLTNLFLCERFRRMICTCHAIKPVAGHGNVA